MLPWEKGHYSGSFAFPQLTHSPPSAGKEGWAVVSFVKSCSTNIIFHMLTHETVGALDSSTWFQLLADLGGVERSDFDLVI